MNTHEEQKDREGEQQENIAQKLNTDDEQDMNKVTIADRSHMLSSNLTKQDGEKKEIGRAVVGADKQQKVIENTIENLHISIASKEVLEDKEEGERDSNLQIVCKEVGISLKVISKNKRSNQEGTTIVLYQQGFRVRGWSKHDLNELQSLILKY
ncbi:hypothetical protein H5410_061089 [Solanum commersonii]|uniref:Uncharacterized protein n=1 Tax=Solanum commersonii TaxID=4109 RepID=A0A9J5W6R7_SOLCO|nr:hypothetical protein H5410_061089 [Solanum commersonii]